MGGKKSKSAPIQGSAQLGVYLQDWAVVHQSKFKKWEKHEGAAWGFDRKINYRSNAAYRLQPWALAGRHYLAYIDRTEFSCNEDSNGVIQNKRLVVEEKKAVGYRWREVQVPDAYPLRGFMEMEDPYHEEKYLERKELFFNYTNVIGCREDTLVIQSVRKTFEMDFLVADRHESVYKVISIYRLLVGDNAYLMEAILSPDMSRYILKPSLFFTRKFKYVEVDNSALLIAVKGRADGCELSELQATLFIGDTITRIFVFDPRYPWQRVAIGNSPEGGENVLRLYDLETNRVIVETCQNSGLHSTQNLEFSPDGRFLVSLIVNPCAAKLGLNMVAYAVYNSDDLTVIHRLSFPEECFTPVLIPYAIFPIFASNGHFMAVATGENEVYDDFLPECSVLVVAVPVVITLQNVCRLAIRKWLPEPRDVKNLNLPLKLKNYLLYKPFLT